MAHAASPEVPAEPGAEPEAEFHTADRVRALNAANPRWWPRYEAVYGELLVTPAPREIHQWMAGELFAELRAYLKRERAGVAYMAPADISWGRRDTTVQPDVFVVPRADVRAARRAKSWDAVRHLLLAAEVLSPSTRHRDRFKKRLLYQRQGVELYWVVDPERRTAEVWTPDAEFPTTERERLVWRPTGAVEAFAFDLAAAFAEFDAG